MIVGPHSKKLPQSWDTGSDQPSVPANSTSVFAASRFLLHGNPSYPMELVYKIAVFDKI